jgi:hypothetical protein
MEKIEITAYLKTYCGWSGIRAVLAKCDLPSGEKDIIKIGIPFEMEQLSGQPLSPCVIVNGTMRRMSAAKSSKVIYLRMDWSVRARKIQTFRSTRHHRRTA